MQTLLMQNDANDPAMEREPTDGPLNLLGRTPFPAQSAGKP